MLRNAAVAHVLKDDDTVTLSMETLHGNSRMGQILLTIRIWGVWEQPDTKPG
jgi:hypothetical protein